MIGQLEKRQIFKNMIFKNYVKRIRSYLNEFLQYINNKVIIIIITWF